MRYKELIAEYLLRRLTFKPTPQEIEDVLDAQSVEIHEVSPTELQLRVLPVNSGAARFFSIKVIERHQPNG